MFSQTIVVGNLGRDPEMRYTQGGVPVCSFSIADTEKWTDTHGQPQEKTTWFRVTAWNKLAETCAQYLSKGRLVMVVGTIGASAWKKDDGTPQASLELNAKTVRFLGGKKDGDDNGGFRDIAGSDPQIDEDEIPF